MFEIKINNEVSPVAEIYFYGDIVGSTNDKWSCDDVCPTEIRDFLNENKDTPLNIHINSGGGDVFGGLAICNMIKAHKGKTICYINGLCASIATVIASSCDEIHLNANSFVMVHNAWCWACGNKEELAKTIEVLEKTDVAILESYANHLKEGVTLDTIKELMDNETWLLGSEVLEYFDFIIDEDEEEKELVFASIKDFKYKNIPTDLLNKINEKDEDEDEEIDEKEPIEEDEDKDEDIDTEIEEELEEDDDEIEVNDKECEECGCNPCICEEIKRKETEEKLYKDSQNYLDYLKAIDYVNKFNK